MPHVDTPCEMPLAGGDLTNIVLTLHRQERTRRDGLALFEQMLSLNLHEAYLALEALDRRLVQMS